MNTTDYKTLYAVEVQAGNVINMVRQEPMAVPSPMATDNQIAEKVEAALVEWKALSAAELEQVNSMKAVKVVYDIIWHSFAAAQSGTAGLRRDDVAKWKAFVHPERNDWRIIMKVWPGSLMERHKRARSVYRKVILKAYRQVERAE